MKDNRKPRKTLAVKVSEEFYDEIVKYAHENYMNVSSLLRKALYDAFGLAESKDSQTTSNQ